MNGHGKKMIAPIIITALIALWILGQVLVCVVGGFPWIVTAIGLAIGLIFMAVMIAVLVSRIKEIRSGEEDDLGKY